MLVGHLAAALAAKKVEPRTPLWAAVGAAFAVDLIWPLLLLTGAEVVRVNPSDTAFTNLAFDSYPWSHSLALVLVWSLILGTVGWKVFGSRSVAVVLGGLVLSHWILDLVTHRPDLPLWPGGPLLGLGLWNSVVGTLAVEGMLIIIATVLYEGVTVADDRRGVLALYSMIGLCTLIWATQPISPPPPSAAAVAWGALALWLFLPWAAVAERHRSLRPGR